MVAISNAESILLGALGDNEGTPLVRVNAPFLVKNNLSILAR
jgi:hypothetical protein